MKQPHAIKVKSKHKIRSVVPDLLSDADHME